MALKRYEPQRTDLLINTDWGIEESALSQDEAFARNMILFHGRWVTEEEKSLLKHQDAAYRGVRFVAWFLWVSSVLVIARTIIVQASPSLRFEQPGLAVLALVLAIFAVPAGIGVYRFTRWGRILANAILIVGIPTIIGVLCLYYLNRKSARLILMAKPSDKGRVDLAQLRTDGLRGVLGLACQQVMWPLIVAFLAGLLFRDLIFLSLGVSIGYIHDSGLSVGFLDFAGVNEWLGSVGTDLLVVLSCIVGLRWVRNEAFGIAIAGIVFVALHKPFMYLIWRHKIAAATIFNPTLILASFVYLAIFLALFAVALRHIRRLLPALLTGALGGSLVQSVIRSIGTALRVRSGTVATELPLSAHLAFALENLVLAAVLALLWYGSIRLLVPDVQHAADPGEGAVARTVKR